MSSVLRTTPASIQNSFPGSNNALEEKNNNDTINSHSEDTIINDTTMSSTTTATTNISTDRRTDNDLNTTDNSSFASTFSSSNKKVFGDGNRDCDLSKKVTQLITFCKKRVYESTEGPAPIKYKIYEDSQQLITAIDNIFIKRDANTIDLMNLLCESLSKVNSSLNYYKLEFMLSDENNAFLKGRNEVENTINLKNMEALNVLNIQNNMNINSNLNPQELKLHKYESLKKIIVDKVDSFEKMNSKIDELSNKALKYKIKYNALKELLHEKDIQLKKLQKNKNIKNSSPNNAANSSNISNSNITPPKFKIYQHQFYNNGTSHSTTPVSSNNTSKTPKRSRKKRNSLDSSKNSILSSSSTKKCRNRINNQDSCNNQEEETIIQHSPDQTILEQSPDFKDQNNSIISPAHEPINSTPFLPSSITLPSSVPSKKRSLSGAAAASSTAFKLPPVFGTQTNSSTSVNSNNTTQNTALSSLVSYSTASQTQPPYKPRIPLISVNKNSNPHNRIGSLQNRAKSSGSFFDTLNMLASQAVLVSSSAASSYERSNMTPTSSSSRPASTASHKVRKLTHDSIGFHHLQQQKYASQLTTIPSGSHTTRRTLSTSSSGSNHSAVSSPDSISSSSGAPANIHNNNATVMQSHSMVKLPGINQILGNEDNNKESTSNVVSDELQNDYAYRQRNYDLNSNDTIDEDQGY